MLAEASVEAPEVLSDAPEEVLSEAPEVLSEAPEELE